MISPNRPLVVDAKVIADRVRVETFDVRVLSGSPLSSTNAILYRSPRSASFASRLSPRATAILVSPTDNSRGSQLRHPNTFEGASALRTISNASGLRPNASLSLPNSPGHLLPFVSSPSKDLSRYNRSVLFIKFLKIHFLLVGINKQ